MKLDANETSLVGRWVSRGSAQNADAVCVRIASLLREQLVELGTSSDGWSTLYRDLADGRYWELTYPESHLHGGGPPALHCLTPVEVQARYAGAA